MTFKGFTQKDFDVFTVPGLDPRMEALKEHVRPKLHEIGAQLAPYLSAQCGEEMYPHVAMHARRTINPPNDTWVAWSNNKRGYKAHPHFQVGMWSTHLFIQFALIYESNNKEVFANQLEKQVNKIRKHIPGEYFWSLDHTKPEVTLHQDMNKKDFEEVIYKLKNIKKAEILCGLQLPNNSPILSDGSQLIKTIEQTFEQLMPLYRISF
jgi:uncharacterized protein YktB (UPF0637 family)